MSLYKRIVRYGTGTVWYAPNARYGTVPTYGTVPCNTEGDRITNTEEGYSGKYA